MKPSRRVLSEYIKSGDYYMDARNWDKYKYIYPFAQRSFVLLLASVVCVLFLGVLININGLFPSVMQVKYSISANSASSKTAQIIKANQIDNDPLASVVDIIIKNYVKKRESYNYGDLKNNLFLLKIIQRV